MAEPPELEEVGAWSPDAGTGRWWTVAGLALTVAAGALFALAYAAPHGGLDLRLGGPGLLLGFVATVLLFALLLVLHELAHGLTMRLYGARPEYGADIAGGVPVFYCTAPGQLFGRTAYAVIALAPLVLLSALGGLAVAYAPFGGWLVLPLALHTGGCIGDLWLLGLALRQPAGTLVEDRRAGIAFHRRR